MDTKTSTALQNIPTKPLMETSGILFEVINNDINNCNFPHELKLVIQIVLKIIDLLLNEKLFICINKSSHILKSIYLLS